MSKLLNVIVACSENRVIGRDGKLPWRIPEDLAFFHTETAGQICVLGRICYQTWPRAGLDGRRPVVITRDTSLVREGAHVVSSFDSALKVAEKIRGEVYICGGQRIYEETFALNRPIRLHLTLVHAEISGDTYFPEWRDRAWHETARRESSDSQYRYTFLTLEGGPW